MENKHHCLAVEDAWSVTETTFRSYGWPLTNVVLFKYLVRLLTATDDTFTEVVVNVWNYCKKWACVSWIMVK